MSELKRKTRRFVQRAAAPIGGWAFARLATVVGHRDDALRLAVGRLEADQRGQLDARQWREAEFKVFSQWNEDGLIQHLVRHVSIATETFIEFGVEDYRESNTGSLSTSAVSSAGDIRSTLVRHLSLSPT
jgi:hypothetical protein